MHCNIIDKQIRSQAYLIPTRVTGDKTNLIRIEINVIIVWQFSDSRNYREPNT